MYLFRYKEALSLLKDCRYPIEEARRLSGVLGTLTDDLKELEADVYYQTCAAESIQAVETGTSIYCLFFDKLLFTGTLYTTGLDN